MRFRLPFTQTRHLNSEHRAKGAAGLFGISALAIAVAFGATTAANAVGPTLPPKPAAGATPTTVKKSTPSKTTRAKSGSTKTTAKKSSASTKGDFTMSAAPSKQTIAAGETTTTQINLKKASGFASIVNITASGVPAGVKISFPPRIQSFAPVSVKVPTSVDDGTYRITFKGTAGKLVHTTVFTLVVDGILEGATDDTLPGLDPTASSTAPGASTVPGASTTTVPGASTVPGSTTIPPSTTSTTTAGVVRPLNSTTTLPGSAGPTTTTLVAAAGEFVIAVNPVRVILPVGGAQTFPITASSNGAPVTNVTYTLAGLPTGVTSSLGTASAQGATAVTVTAPAGTAPGTSVITVAGSANGKTKSATFELIVTADLAVAVTPQALVATAGGSTSGSVTLGTVTTFTAVATLSISGLPAGVTPTFASPSFTSGTTTLTLAVAATVPVGTYPFTVTATAGSTVRSSIATLAVNAANGTTVSTGTGTAAELSVAVNPTAQSTAINGNVRYTITVSGTAVGTAGAVIAVGGLPQNATISVVSNPTTNTATISITVGSPVALGVYNLTISATAGSLVRTSTAQLTVTA